MDRHTGAMGQDLFLPNRLVPVKVRKDELMIMMLMKLSLTVDQRKIVSAGAQQPGKSAKNDGHAECVGDT